MILSIIFLRIKVAIFLTSILTLALFLFFVAVENRFLCIFISLFLSFFLSFFLSPFFSVVLYYLLSSVCLFYLFFLVHRQVGVFHLQLLNPGRIPKPPEVERCHYGPEAGSLKLIPGSLESLNLDYDVPI
jgi:hypothetical protein